MDFLRGKKVLLVGLGILGGGLATANFLVKNGAKLTITDLKTKKELKNTIKKIKNFSKIKFVLGRHNKEDFKGADLVIFNPAVPFKSPWITLAKKHKKDTENDLTLFLELLKKKIGKFKYIGITGTRGKTTTTTWISKLIPNAVLGGNIPEKALFKIINKNGNYVLELSSAQLEFTNKSTLAPHIAVITNIYNDHLNRYKLFKHYIDTKALIFKNQTKDDYLVLNRDNKYYSYFLKKKPKAKIFYISLNKLPKRENGLFFTGNKITFQNKEKIFEVAKINEQISLHHNSNLLAAILTAYLWGESWQNILRKIKILPQIPFRQETVFEGKKIKIINDSAATSPDATIAAIDCFRNEKKLILISGGTDKNLDFRELAIKIKKTIRPKNLFLLDGSATKKLIDYLTKNGYYSGWNDIKTYSSLGEIFKNLSIKNCKDFVLLFSPASASFEKFKNEFDRGRQFNKLVKKYIKIWKNHHKLSKMLL